MDGTVLFLGALWIAFPKMVRDTQVARLALRCVICRFELAFEFYARA